MRALSILLVVFTLISCTDDENNDYNNRQNKINIYLTKQNDESGYDETPLQLLNLETTPWVKSADIEFYDWSAHAFYLNTEVEKAKYSGRTFAVCDNQERLFKGVFWPMYMSSFPSVPSILPTDDWFSPKDVILFNTFGWLPASSLEDNELFKAALIKANLLKEGIEVELIKLEKVNATTLKYTFTVKNNESENIYIFDPSKMGTKHFHYYTNGVSLQHGDTYFYASELETEAIDEMKDEWYYRLKPGELISRTVQISGYSDIPTGEVEASFQFPGADLKKTGEWKKTDGRVWIGSYGTKTSVSIR